MTLHALQALIDRPLVQRVMAVLRDHGAEGRLVGGCVRDAVYQAMAGLLSHNSAANIPERDVDLDIDMATTAQPDAVMAMFAEVEGIKPLPTGIDHGTVTILDTETRQQIELTTLRSDVATNGRHARVKFTDDWEADAARRDFTINALYVDATCKVYDYFGGQRDLAEGKVQFIGDIHARISEDYLRILRYLRFSGRFAKSIDALAETKDFKACVSAKKHVQTLSRERIRDEMLKMMAQIPKDRCIKIVELMQQTNLWTAVYGDISHPNTQMAQACDWQALSPLLRLLSFMPLTSLKLDRKVKASLVFSNNEMNHLKIVSKVLDEAITTTSPQWQITCYRFGVDAVRDALALEGTCPPEELETYQPPSFPASGQDIMALGIPEGQQVGAVLSRLETWWLASWAQDGIAPERAATQDKLHQMVAGESQ